MGKESATCPVCKRGEGVDEQRISASMESYQCPVCGEYEMPPFVPDVHGAAVPNHKLSAWIREQNERGQPVRFAQKGMIESILAGIPDYKPSEKQLKLLRNIERRTHRPGQIIALNGCTDFPLAYAEDSMELAFYVDALEERTLIRAEGRKVDRLSHDETPWAVAITSTGWDYLDRQASDLEEKTQAFVAMSFSDQMKPMWKGAIQPAIEEAGYTAYRVDEKPHSDNIIFKIMAEIRNSRFVVADITEQKNGVYFEGGYALGLGLPVIWSVRKDDADNVHFDTAQYNQIRWDSVEQLRDSLYDFICAIIGKRSRLQR